MDNFLKVLNNIIFEDYLFIDFYFYNNVTNITNIDGRNKVVSFYKGMDGNKATNG